MTQFTDGLAAKTDRQHGMAGQPAACAARLFQNGLAGGQPMAGFYLPISLLTVFSSRLRFFVPAW
jgi:hypothetical protein